MIHPYRPRPYHNPHNIDESKVPAGWRFRYADEAGTPAKTPCIAWIEGLQSFSHQNNWRGGHHRVTYIVPVDA